MEFSVTPETCRICLNNSPRSKPMSDGYASGPAYNLAKEELRTCLEVYKFLADPPIRLLPTPPMSNFFPTRICDDCEAQLIITYEFRRKTIRSENVLKNLLNLYAYQQQVAEPAEPAVEPECIVKEEPEECATYEEPEIQIPNESNELENEQSESFSDRSDQLDSIGSENQISTKDPTIEQLLCAEKQPNSNSERVFKLKPRRSQCEKQPNSKFKLKPRQSQCEDCGKIVLTKNLPYHRNTHKADEDKQRPFACDLCDKRFTLKDTLGRHKRFHANDRRYPCPYCEKKFLHYTSHRYHIQHVHLGKKNVSIKKLANMFPCEVCQKSYKTPRTLALHKQIMHATIKNFICSICSQAFSQKFLLNKHVVKRHRECIG